MKIFFKMSMFLCACIVLIACSNDEETTPQEQNLTTSISDSTKNKGKGFDYFNATAFLIDKLQNGPAPKFPLDQATLDSYLDEMGVKEGMNVEDANKIIDQVSIANEMGFEKYIIQEIHVQTFTKETVLKIMEKGAVKDLESDPDFRMLPLLEQNMLLTANSVAINYAANGALFGGGKQVIPAIAGAVAGAYAGAYFGGFCCGPVGGLVGGIIGGVLGGLIGWFSGNSK